MRVVEKVRCSGGNVNADIRGPLQVRPWTFFEDGMVGHISMANPFDKVLSATVHNALSPPGTLDGEGVQVHFGSTLICIGQSAFHWLAFLFTR